MAPDAGPRARAAPASPASWAERIRMRRRAAYRSAPNGAGSCQRLGTGARRRLLRRGGPDLHCQLRRIRVRARCNGARHRRREARSTEPALHFVVGKAQAAMVEFVAAEFEFMRRKV